MGLPLFLFVDVVFIIISKVFTGRDFLELSFDDKFCNDPSCIARIFVQRLVELADQFFEDRPHRRVVDPIRMQVDLPESLQHLEQQAGFVELGDRVVEVELLQHFAHVLAESGDVIAQIRGQVRRVTEQLVEVVAGRVVEREPRRLAQLRIEIFELPATKLGLLAEHLLLGSGKHAIEAPQHGQRQDDILVFAALESVTDQVRNAP